VLGEAFVGPARLPLREHLTARAPLVATLQHGDRLEIIGRRRRFVKVRTTDGKQGWADSRLLLSSADMKDLRSLAERAAQSPSQGKATAFDLLNAHTAPNRQSPSFFQITPEDRVDVITHLRAPRVPFEPPSFDDDSPAAQLARARKQKKKQPDVPPPPAGPPPSLPEEWLEMSQPRFSQPPSRTPAAAKSPAPQSSPTPSTDDWTLVRDKQGRAGWVLTRMLLMTIPDEVAQYAERARITSYFQLGSLKDRTVEKPTWLWTTLSRTAVDHHFDSIRIFTWSTRRHRYETSYIERNLTGWGPVLLHQSSPGQPLGFSLIVQEKDGQTMRRYYAAQGARFRLVRREPAEVPPPWYAKSAAAPPASGETSQDSPAGIRQRAAEWLKQLLTRLRR
jgi:hypothetical protein